MLLPHRLGERVEQGARRLGAPQDPVARRPVDDADGRRDERHARVATFSRGMQQRLALCRTLLHAPELVLLDEPFAGLDADAALLVDRELRELAGRQTVMLSTHAPERLEPLAPQRLALAPT